tara:strand:- start:28 stop:873 length:846 start_codon:yes stop_codon:yes gene_type:complete
VENQGIFLEIKMFKSINNFLLLILIIIFSIGYIIFFLDSDTIKSEIEEYVSSKINYTFVYDGDLNISYAPDARLSITDIKISDESYEPVKKIANIGSLELIIDKEKIIDKIIDVQKIEALDAIYFGVNLDEILLKTYSLIKFKKFQNISVDNNTVLNQLFSNAVIDNGIMKIKNIYFETSLLKASGKGVIDLNQRTIKIDMFGKVRDIKSISEDVKNIYTNHYPDDLVNKELPIIIRGSLDNPDITIDIEYIIKKEIINPLKDKLLEKITDDLKEQIKLPF